MSRRSPLTLSLTAMVFLLAGCSSSKKVDGPTEVVDKAVVTSETAEEELFDEARSHYERRLFSSAAKSFEALATSYPLGAYGSYAQLKLGDSHYHMGAYPEAAQVFESFVNEHPGHSAIAYALYMAGLSNLKANSGVGRDMEPVEKSKQHFETLINDHSDSPYAMDARHRLHETEEVLADNEQRIMEFYKKTDLNPAFKERAASHRRHVAAIDALKRRSKTSTVIGGVASGQPAILASYQTGVSSVRSVKSASTIALSERARLGTNTRLPNSATSIKTKIEQKFISTLESVTCKGDGLPTVVLELDSSTSNGMLRSLARENASVKARQGQLAVSLPGVKLPDLSEHCFSNSEITSSPDSNVLISGNFKRAVALPMNDPPRLAIVLQ